MQQYIWWSRADGLKGRTQLRDALPSDTPLQVLLRDERIVSGMWGAHQKDENGKMTLCGAMMAASPPPPLLTTTPTTSSAAEQTLATLATLLEADDVIAAARKRASTSPTAARIVTLWDMALDAVGRNDGLRALLFATELFATLATLEEQRVARTTTSM